MLPVSEAPPETQLDDPSGEAAVQDHCALHPEQAATAGTCERCGSFMCDACLSDMTEKRFCVVCARRLGGGRWLRHVPVLGILMMVQGAMTLGMALLLLMYGAFTALALGDLPPSDDPAQAAISSIMLGGMVGMGLMHLPAGVMQLLAGWRVRTFHSRWLAIGSIWLGLSTVFGCYCLPTALAMIVYGSVVLHRREVIARFDAEEPTAT